MQKWLIRVLIVWSFIAFTPSVEGSKKKICLNMIVKNETKVIKRSLASVKPYIDYWVIVDTGSTDGTQEMIKEFMSDIPGALYERPWVNFAHNRNEALDLAKTKGDYLLFIDADEELIFDKKFDISSLDKDYYYITSRTDYNLTFLRIQLISTKKPFTWIGALHEYISPLEESTDEILHGVYNWVRTGQGRIAKDPDTYKKDAEILEKALLDNPDDTRSLFYLANTYVIIRKLQEALATYQKRIALGGNVHEEIFFSQLQVGKLQKELGYPNEVFLKSFYDAYVFSPARLESIYEIICCKIEMGQIEEAYALAKLASHQPKPKCFLFMDDWIYEYGLQTALADTAFYLKKYEEAVEVSRRILSNEKVPSSIHERIKGNLPTIFQEAGRSG